MRRVIITIVVLFASPVWALTYMGPVASNVKEGDFLLGFDYSDSEMDLEMSGFGLSETLEDVESDLYLGKVGLGLSDGFEFFGRFGMSEINDSGNEFTWGLGTKATFGEKDNISWGVLFQFMSLYEGEENIDGSLVDGDLDIYEFQVAFGPRYDMDGLYIYGGPFFHFIDGEVNLEYLGDTLSFDIEQESEFGGYVGMGWQIAENSSLSVEYQFTSDAHAIGISLLNKFGGSPKPEKRTVTQRPTPTLKTEPKVDASGRLITGYRVKRDASGEIVKDKDGSYIFNSVYEDEEKK